MTNWVWKRFGDKMKRWSSDNPTLGVPVRYSTWISGSFWLDGMVAKLGQFWFGRGIHQTYWYVREWFN